MNNIENFKKHVGQTSDFPLGLEVERAKGVYIYDNNGNRYMDLISGLSVNNLGHCNAEIVKAIKDQADKHLHLMVYGEFIQKAQTELAVMLSSLLPESLSNCFFVNSGSEAVEGSLKLAKRFTGRTEIISFNNAYHGGTHGAFSLMGHESYRNSFRPLLPDVRRLNYNDIEDLEKISERTACVILEPIQAEAGIIVPSQDFMERLRKKCTETGALLIFDEVQTGFGRTGSLFAFEALEIVPDILVLGKALGGGMPVAAFVSSEKIMSCLRKDPVLGHITTFGGHPVCCAAALASLKILSSRGIVENVNKKAELYRKLLKHKQIKEVRGKGLFMAFELKNRIRVKKLLPMLLENGILSNSFIFRFDSFRIAPPLIISEDEIKESAKIILNCLDKL
jgi:acetylornithine/succinyldiaminopimelate/putrescine aminotransferase